MQLAAMLPCLPATALAPGVAPFNASLPALVTLRSHLRGLLNTHALDAGPPTQPRRSPTVGPQCATTPAPKPRSQTWTSFLFIRCYASGTSTERPHELLASKCRVLPFSLSREDAEGEWERHHAGVFTSRPGGWDAVKAVLLPFWCISAEAQIHVASAQVGRNHLVTRYNPATRRSEPRWETEWTTVHPDWRYARRWGSETTEAQVYGGSKLRHDPALRALKPAAHVLRALPYSDYVRQSDAAARAAAAGGAASVVPDRMYPFRLAPTEAAEAARQSIRDAELRNAESQLLSTYGGDSVRLVSMEVALAGLAATPVFVPAHVFKTRIRGTAMRTFVAGFAPGVTSGPVLPNPNRVATAAAVATPAALLAGGALAGAVPGLHTVVWLGAVLPGLLGYAVASMWPELHAGALRLRARLQRPLPESGEAEQEAWWRTEWVRQDLDDGYSFGADGRYGGSYKYGGRSGGRQQAGGRTTGGRGFDSAAGASPRDPRGYYRTLGVSPDCSTEELQAAFRAAALKWHPDRQPDPARKAESTRRFQQAQEAYSVLRDPSRRAAYDRA